MKRAPVNTSAVTAINDRHIHTIDKLYRMHAGASSTLLELGKTSFLLEIRFDHRVTEENTPRLIWNISRSWRNSNPELSHCITCVVYLHRSPGSTGFVLPGSAHRSEIAAALDELRNTCELPAPLIGRYLLSFDPVEVMVRAPDRIPGAVDN